LPQSDRLFRAQVKNKNTGISMVWSSNMIADRGRSLICIAYVISIEVVTRYLKLFFSGDDSFLII
jgi:hypothetical protein